MVKALIKATAKKVIKKKKPSPNINKKNLKKKSKIELKTKPKNGNVFAPPEATVNKRANVLKKYKANKIDWVKVPEKYYRDEDKYESMMMAGKKLSDVQLKAYSKAIKFTTDNMAEIDGRQYVTRKARDNIKGTVNHALKEMDFLPKEYLALYKKKK
tara:strand:+ start:144 stop:614 length:471 start_codon:yes stop_codon:yes gene_type:complete